MQGFLTYNATTNEDGRFSIDSLLVDKFTLNVSGKGFVSTRTLLPLMWHDAGYHKVVERQAIL